MKNTIKADRKLSLRTHTIRDLTAEDLRLAVGGRSGSGSGGAHGNGSGSGFGGGGRDGSYGSYGNRAGFLSS